MPTGRNKTKEREFETWYRSSNNAVDSDMFTRTKRSACFSCQSTQDLYEMWTELQNASAEIKELKRIRKSVAGW